MILKSPNNRFLHRLLIVSPRGPPLPTSIVAIFSTSLSHPPYDLQQLEDVGDQRMSFDALLLVFLLALMVLEYLNTRTRTRDRNCCLRVQVLGEIKKVQPAWHYPMNNKSIASIVLKRGV
ncbi:hypothetical protein PROFUN_06096 [Planoprotostelium fungivorum]|uniref:Uncharacterized protein n=1 Tax=Planoprotostelium fungivorum TaxID=1890364 RepID=A0A2P6NPU3_9EUKA|nr:hypothetical protein PROFUN_06096 [Planoprotostelium fungivorum]